MTNYNNYYEFDTDKSEPAILAKDFKPRPGPFRSVGWSTTRRPTASRTLTPFPQEERIYRLRCVEAWSMVIPWQGFPLASC